MNYQTEINETVFQWNVARFSDERLLFLLSPLLNQLHSSLGLWITVAVATGFISILQRQVILIKTQMPLLIRIQRLLQKSHPNPMHVCLKAILTELNGLDNPAYDCSYKCNPKHICPEASLTEFNGHFLVRVFRTVALPLHLCTWDHNSLIPLMEQLERLLYA